MMSISYTLSNSNIGKMYNLLFAVKLEAITSLVFILIVASYFPSLLHCMVGRCSFQT